MLATVERGETMSSEKKLGLLPMVAAILAGMIGSGVYDIAYQLGTVTSPGGAIVAWAVCFVGMLLFVLSLQNLLQKEPGGDGMFCYAQKLFGPLGEFMSAWGYWISGWVGNIAFATMMMIALGTFFPVLGDTGTSWGSIAIASAFMWLMFLLISKGVENAMILNAAVTVVKIIPLVVFIGVTVFFFNFDIFATDFWSNFAGNVNLGQGFDLGSVFGQVTDSMLSIIWLFMGVESAALMSKRAKSKAVASKASIIGLFIGTALLFICAMIPYGLMSAEEFVALGEPSIGKILELYVGPIAAQLVEACIIISIAGAWLAYTIMPTESTQILADDHLLPARWGKTNQNGTAMFSLFVTTLLAQLLLITMHFTEDAYNFGFSLSSSAILVTWVMITAYNTVRSIKHPEEQGRVRNIIIGAVGTLYMLYAMFVSGIEYIMLLSIPFLIGVVFLYQARKEAGLEKVFNTKEIIAIVVLAVFAAVSLAMFVMGMV